MQGKPFVKLFQSPNGNYCYDVNRNEILELDEDSFRYLCAVDDANPPASKPDGIVNLEQQGYLSSYRVSKIEHPFTSRLEDILSRSMRKITIQLTQDCNFRCKYCGYSQSNDRQRSHAKRIMPIETAKKAILFFRDHAVDIPDVALGFYGGEPLLEFKLLKELAVFAEEVFSGKRSITFHITTNASLITDEIVEFFIAHHFHVLISLDGIKEINDKNRVFANEKGTFDVIAERLTHIYQKYPDFYKQLTVNMVLDPSNDFDAINQIFDSAEVFRHTNFQYSPLNDQSSDTPVEWSEQYISKSTYHYFLKNLALAGYYPSNRLSPIALQDATHTIESLSKLRPQSGLPDIGCPGGPCTPGELRTMVTVEGKLIVCERVSEVSDCMIIGDVEHGFNFEKAKALLNVASLSPDECRNCWVFRYCKCCATQADSNGKLSKEQKLRSCNIFKDDFSRLLRTSILLKEVRPYYGAGR